MGQHNFLIHIWAIYIFPKSNLSVKNYDITIPSQEDMTKTVPEQVLTVDLLSS